MKRVVSILILLTLLLSGCGAERGQRQIALIVKGTETEFWQSVYRGAQAAAAEFDVCLTMHGPRAERDGTEQMETIKQVVAMEPDCILLAVTCLDGKETGDYYTDIYVVDKTMIFEPPYEQLIFPFEKPSQ